jgi:DNA-binding Lrp family transcriptional regulator
VDAKDHQIIRLLQEHGRLTNQELADRVNLSPSPCLRRVRRLEEVGIIAGYAAIIDQKRCGLEITAFLRVRLQRHGDEEIRIFEGRVAALDEVLDCFLMTGDADYLLRVVVPDLESYERFVRRKMHAIPGIAALDTSFAYGTVKSGRVLPII